MASKEQEWLEWLGSNEAGTYLTSCKAYHVLELALGKMYAAIRQTTRTDEDAETALVNIIIVSVAPDTALGLARALAATGREFAKDVQE